MRSNIAIINPSTSSKNIFSSWHINLNAMSNLKIEFCQLTWFSFTNFPHFKKGKKKVACKVECFLYRYCDDVLWKVFIGFHGYVFDNFTLSRKLCYRSFFVFDRELKKGFDKSQIERNGKLWEMWQSEYNWKGTGEYVSTQCRSDTEQRYDVQHKDNNIRACTKVSAKIEFTCLITAGKLNTKFSVISAI